MLLNYYLSILDPFVLHTNLIHNCFPESEFFNINIPSTVDYINPSHDLVGLVDTLHDPRVWYSNACTFTKVNYIPVDLLDYYYTFEKRFGIKHDSPDYYFNQYSSHYDTRTIMNHIFSLSDFQIKEAKRLNLPKPQCWTLEDLNSEELDAILLSENDQNSVFLTTAAIDRVLQLTAPSVNLHYPEAFIASPSLIHDDLFFVHILQFQYWLWFIFISLIVFFFITFICVARWCNVRTKPRRETRGVSRSKCGDFITAMVPLSWAGSIIVSESTDPTDYYDGFGTSEMVIGIRAYQWGWEYYYPKNTDIMYNVRPNYTTFTGNSLMYNKASGKTTDSNSLWKFYQNNLTDGVITPAHLLVLPNDNAKVLNHLNFNDIGANTLKESQAFKKIRQSSKTFTSNLVLTPGTFVGKYNSLYDLYLRDTNVTDSGNYGNVRQHNLTATLASTNVNKVSLDTRSSVKFISQNLGTSSAHSVKEGSVLETQPTWMSQTDVREVGSSKANLLRSTRPTKSWSFEIDGVRNSQNTSAKVSSLSNPLTQLFNPEVLDGSNWTSPKQPSSFTSLSSSSEFLNTPTVLTESSNNAALTQLLPSNQSVRGVTDLNVNKPSVNFDPTLGSYNNVTQTVSNGLTNNLYSGLETHQVDTNTTSRLLANRLKVDFAESPILSNNPLTSTFEFDSWRSKQLSIGFRGRSLQTRFNDGLEAGVNDSPNDQPLRLYTGSDVGALTTLRSPYWSMYWGRSNPDLRVFASFDSTNLHRFFYLQEPTDYAEYDFRNAQAADLFEEALWESSYSAYSHQDYIELLTNYKNSAYAPKVTQQPITFFYPKQFNFSLDAEPSLQSHLKDVSNTGTFYTNSIFFDDYVLPTNLVSTKTYSLLTNVPGVEGLDESGLGLKGLSGLFNSSTKNGLNVSSVFPTTTSSLDVLNAFRADFEDFSWSTSLDMSSSAVSTKALMLPSLVTTSAVLDLLPSEAGLVGDSTRSGVLTSDNLVLRGSARNSILSYNALQKVFRSRYEEGRANVSPLHYTESAVRKPNLSANRPRVEGMLGKNKQSYFTPLFFKTEKLGLFNELYNFNLVLNFQTFDFPFLLAETSDPAKFLWLDWRAKWGRKEVQPALTARLSLLASPHTRKHFDFNVDDLDSLQRWDFYSLRLARARKNYLTNWAFTPQAFLKNHVWFAQDRNLQTLSKGLQSGYQGLPTTVHLLTLMESFWATPVIYLNASSQFTPSSSGVTSPSHVENSYPTNTVSSYAVNSANLVDYLTKREYLYRQLSTSLGGSVYVPKGLTASPNNPLIHLFKTSYNLTDPVNVASESLRSQFQDQLGTNPKGSEYLLKSQYKPLKKGISNMLRLHATGTVAMPIEMRLQILASSRDIIHSWSVPGAGIKIDCVPGYTSHRTAIFLVSGIYWGQCMEICGRYHHWMPIVVQFMKRDLFFLWCTHFVFQPTNSKGWDITSRQHADFVRVASFDENTWVNELGR